MPQKANAVIQTSCQRAKQPNTWLEEARNSFDGVDQQGKAFHEDWLGKWSEKDRRRRYQTASDMRADLQHLHYRCRQNFYLDPKIYRKIKHISINRQGPTLRSSEVYIIGGYRKLMRQPLGSIHGRSAAYATYPYLCASLLDLECDDPRLEKALEWMARSVTGDGVASTTDKKAPVLSLRHISGRLPPVAFGYWA